MSAKNNGGAPRRNFNVRPRSWIVTAITLLSFACTESPGGDSSSGGNTSMDGPDTAGASSTTESFGWCDVQPLVVAKCGRCHGAPPSHGAPFSLLDYADTQIVDSKGVARFERMRTAVESGLMPAQYVKLSPPVEALTETERARLLDWLTASAPRGDLSGCP